MAAPMPQNTIVNDALSSGRVSHGGEEAGPEEGEREDKPSVGRAKRKRDLPGEVRGEGETWARGHGFSDQSDLLWLEYRR